MKKLFNFNQVKYLRLQNCNYKLLPDGVNITSFTPLYNTSLSINGIDYYKNFLIAENITEYAFSNNQWIEITDKEVLLNAPITGTFDPSKSITNPINLDRKQEIIGYYLNEENDTYNYILNDVEYLKDFLKDYQNIPLDKHLSIGSEIINSFRVGIHTYNYTIMGRAPGPFPRAPMGRPYTKTLAFILDLNFGIRIYDITDIENPQYIGEKCLIVGEESPVCIYFKDNYVYVGIAGNTEEHNKVNIYKVNFDPVFSFTLYSYFPTYDEYIIYVYVKGDYLYVLTDQNFYKIKWIGISSFIIEDEINSLFNYRTFSVNEEQTHAFLTGNNNYHLIVDLDSFIVKAIIMKVVPKAINNTYHFISSIYKNNYLYITYFRNINSEPPLGSAQKGIDGFFVYHIEDLNHLDTNPPVQISDNLLSEDYYYYNIDDLPLESIHITEENKLYLLSGTRGIYEFDISDPENIIKVNNYSVFGRANTLTFINKDIIVITVREGTTYVLFLSRALYKNNEFIKDLGENKYWQHWEYNGNDYIPVDSVYTTSYLKFDNNIFPSDKVVFSEEGILINSDRENPVIFEELKNFELPSQYTLNKIFLDSKIQNPTQYNFIGIRLIDEQNREWLYSSLNNRWEYIGMNGGEFLTTSNEYQTLDFINRYIYLLTEPKSLRLKVKVVSDNNNVYLYSCGYFLEDISLNTSKISLSGKLVDVRGNPMVNVSIGITVKIPQANMIGDNVVIYNDNPQIIQTDSSGKFEIDIPSNTNVYVTIPSAGIRKLINVTNEDINLGDLLLQ